MKAIKKILCPVDAYNFQPDAAEYAVTLATALDAEIVVLYVMEPVAPHNIGDGSPLPTIAEVEEAKQHADAKVAEIMPHFCGPCRNTGEVTSGSPADEIIWTAEKRPCDLIVMASHCRSLVCRAIHGSVTNKVLANTKTPVLVVYPEEK